MLAIEVSFLTGRYVATAHHDRTAHEWPPHGARLYSAMVATWADCEALDESERAALEWLEAQPPPRISAPEAVPRRTVSHFVPVNDTRVISQSAYERRVTDVADLLEQFDDAVDEAGARVTRKVENLQNKIDKRLDVESLVATAGNTPVESALAMLPDDRGKKERSFPSVTLVTPSAVDDTNDSTQSVMHQPPIEAVTYMWDETPNETIVNALDSLLGRVTRLGHSSSLVSCRLTTEVPPATHTPGEGASILRWVRPGQLEALEQEHNRHQLIRPRSLPYHGIRYRETDQSDVAVHTRIRPDTAGDWIVFELEARDRRMPVTRAVELAKVLRSAVLSHVPNPLPEGVSGHLPDGQPTSAPHISFLVLPNVGNEHSDGRIMGLAVSLPRGLDDSARTSVLRGIGRWERKRNDESLQLTMGSNGAIEMRRKQPLFTLKSLNQRAWARSSRWWVSATPVALPTHPGNLGGGSSAARAKAWRRAEAAVVKSCKHVGLSEPSEVRLSLTPFLRGARPAADYPAFKQGNSGVMRRLVHVAVEFTEEIGGPLLLGSGRFLGLGLMRPVDESHRPKQDINDGDKDA